MANEYGFDRASVDMDAAHSQSVGMGGFDLACRIPSSSGSARFFHAPR